MELISQTYCKVSASIQVLPTLKSWLVACLLLAAIAGFCIPTGISSGFLTLEILDLTILKALRVSVSRFFFPALVEELIFRVLFLPVRPSNMALNLQLTVGLISLVAYVAGHPINAFLFYRSAFDTFTHPFFLFATVVLGVACTISYLESGSIWTPTVIHWITVQAWLFIFGGYSQLDL